MTSLKFLRFLKGKLETPYVVSYFFNGFLADFPFAHSAPLRLCVKSVLPNRAVRLEHALTAPQPFDVEFVVQFRFARDVPVTVDSLAPARSALAGLHLRSNSFRRFPSGSSIHIDYFVPLCGMMPPFDRKYGGSAKMASNRPSGYLAAMASNSSKLFP